MAWLQRFPKQMVLSLTFSPIWLLRFFVALCEKQNHMPSGRYKGIACGYCMWLVVARLTRIRKKIIVNIAASNQDAAYKQTTKCFLRAYWKVNKYVLLV